MDDLRKNGSGIYDETAYKAIQNVSKNRSGGGTTMNGNFAEKDIVEVETANGIKQYLLLACHDTYATALMLNDAKPRENGFEVKSRALMHTDTGKLSYVFYDKIIEYIKTVTDAEFAEIKQAIADTLRITDLFSERTAGSVAEIREVEMCLSEADKEELEKIMRAAVQAVIPAEAYEKTDFEREAAETKIVELRAERNVYRELYMNLLQNLKGEKS